jgi:L-2-hydroxyglutarate oxidase LhgO
MTCDIDVVIIGAGVIGLAIASRVARENRSVFILEKNESFGLETSSRNSGTIHTSVLSPRGSANARFSLEGNPLMYEICRKYGIDYLKCGKVIIGADSVDIAILEKVYQRREEGIRMQWLSQHEMYELEPDVKAEVGILLPEAGVLDVYSLMRCYLGIAKMQGAQLVCKSEVTGIEKTAEGYDIKFREAEGISHLQTRVVINCAGLYSDHIAEMAGIDTVKEGYKQIYLKGEYYSISSAWAKKMDRRLVYPIVRPDRLMGLHNVFDVDRRVRLGPDFYPVDKIDYSIDDSLKQLFYEGVNRLYSGVGYDDIEPESSGIMPRLYLSTDNFKEFIVRHELDRGLLGLINLVGIETPGVTASPAIARYVSEIVDDILRN